MKGAIFESFQGPISIEDLPMPECGDDSVIMEVYNTGICKSDWHGWMGHDDDIVLPHVPGHEFVGGIVEVGRNINSLRIGQRIIVPFCCGCGTCPTCQEGNSHICDQYFQPGFTSWGSFAQFVRIDYAEFNSMKIPEGISNEVAASLGCRFITAFRAIRDQAKIKRNQYLAVFGCGGVGLSAIMIAKALGANVIGVDINPIALEWASKLGADHCINSVVSSDVPIEIKELSKGGAHTSIDAIGSMDCCEQALSSLRKRGKHVQVGLMKGTKSLSQSILGLMIANELELIGSHGMPAKDFPDVFELILSGKVNPINMIQYRLNLAEGVNFLMNMGKNEHSGVALITDFTT